MQTMVTVTELKAPETAETEKPKIRLAPYCRVSSPSEDQLHSFAAQIRHYTEYVGTHPEYELVDIYADEGLSGTSMQKRDELNRLLRDCAKGKVDRIITKSVSRLSRNAKEFLETVRLLKSLGVSIYFEEQGIDTDKLNAEMILTFPGLHAQQESENISRNTRWSIQKRMARGEYFGTHAPLGYRFQDGRLTVEEPEAETVRRIFDLYLQGYGCQSIAEILNESERTFEPISRKRFLSWHPGTIRYIIGNERYIGDALLQKGFNTDTIPYRARKNRGEKKQYYVENAHAPIISRNAFEATQDLLKSRISPNREKWERHQLNGKLICPDCGGNFRRSHQQGKTEWICASKSREKTTCAGRCIQEETVYRIFRLLLLKLHDYGDALLGTLIDQLETLQAVTADDPERFQSLNREISNLAAQNLVLTRLYNKKLLPTEDYYAQSGDIDRQIRNLQNKRKRLLQEQDESETVDTLRHLRDVLRESDPIGNPERLMDEIVERMTVRSATEVTFRLIGGVELTESLNGKGEES